jgi:tetratricopeptide (TPR) repeat protein
MGRSGKKRESHQRAEILLRHETFLLVQKGRAALRRGRGREAEEAFRKVLAIEPSHRAALSGLGELYLRGREHPKACETLELALAAGDRSEHLLYALATACRGAQRREKAFKYLQQLVELNPSHLKGLTRLGEAYLERRDFVAAESTFRQALELDSRNLYALRGLATALRGRRAHSDAIPLYEQLLRLDPDDLRVLVRLGEAYATTGDARSARHAFELALRVDPQNPYARSGLDKLA